MKTLVFDPSGNFIEGNGTSGWVLYSDDDITTVGQLVSDTYKTQVEYWLAHTILIDHLKPDIIVIEEYILYAHATKVQIGSQLETPQLIGILRYYAYINNIICFMQSARIKKRFSNEILLHKNIVTQDTQKRYYAANMPINKHILDAIRHGEYFKYFNRKKVIK